MKKACLAVICTTLVFLSGFVIAETISVPVGQQGTDQQNAAKPIKGLSKAQVLSKFGEPEKKASPIGTPPISRWVYTGYTVYFDSDYVIHSVVHP